MTGQEERELNERLARLAGIVDMTWLEPCEYHPQGLMRFDSPKHYNPVDCKPFTHDLSACFHPDYGIVAKLHICEVVFRFYPGVLHCIITVEDEGGFTDYDGEVLNEPPHGVYNIEKSALALCLAADKIPKEDNR